MQTYSVVLLAETPLILENKEPGWQAPLGALPDALHVETFVADTDVEPVIKREYAPAVEPILSPRAYMPTLVTTGILREGRVVWVKSSAITLVTVPPPELVDTAV